MARQTRQDDLRKDQRQLYVDALIHADAFGRRVDRFADPYYGDGSSKQERDRTEAVLVARNQITARMTLVGHPQVAEAWRSMILVDEAWDSYWGEVLCGDPDVMRDGLGNDDEWIKRARAAVAALQQECRGSLAAKSLL